MAESKDNVKVAIRVRPLSDKERRETGGKTCVAVQKDLGNVIIDARPENKTFTFDYVADMEVPQEEIFEKVGKPISISCMSGYNGTIFAYGQTGAGKTFTILGPDNDGSMEDYEGSEGFQRRGLMPRCIEHIFSSITHEQRQNSEMEYLVKASFLEIYQEQVIDLLTMTGEGFNLQLREDIKKGVYVDGLIEENVSSIQDTYELLKTGTNNRHVGSTSMNKESSRSHSVFTLTIESKQVHDGVTNFRSSRFHMIDLAGSERQKSTDAIGERLREAGMINKSLSALGNVINSLVDIAEGKSRHVHYRDSKLTFLLKDSLGGNSRTYIVANVSPSASSFGETLSTLKFAQRAKMIKNKAVVNEDTAGSVHLLKDEIRRLKEELSNMREVTLLAVDQCPKCAGLMSQSSKIPFMEASSDRLVQLEILLERNTKLRVRDTKALEEQLGSKENYIKSLLAQVGKFEKKVSNDKMVLKFRDSTIARLQGNTVSDDPELENAKKEIVMLRDQLEGTSSAAKLFMENERLKEELAALHKEVMEDPDSLIVRVRENQEYTEQVVEWLNDDISTREKMKSIYADYLKYQSGELLPDTAAVCKQADLLDLKLTYADRISDLTDKLQSAESAYTELDATTHKRMEQQAKRIEELASENAFLGRKCEEVVLLHSKVENQQSISEDTVKRLMDEVAMLTDSLAQTKVELEQSRREATEMTERNEALETLLQSSAEDLKYLETQQIAVQSTLETLNSDHLALKHAKAEDEMTISGLNNDVLGLQTTLEGKVAELTSLSQELETAQDDNQFVKTEIAELRRSLEDLKDENEELEGCNDGLTQTVKEQEDQLVAWKRCSEEDSNRLREEVERVRRESEETVAGLEAEIGKMQREKTEFDRKNALLSSENGEFRRKIESIQSQSADFVEKIAYLESELSVLNEEKQALELFNSSLQGDNLSLEHEKSVLEGQNLSLSAAKAQLEAEKSILEDEKSLLEHEKSLLKHENQLKTADLQSTISQQSVEIATLTELLSETRSHSEGLLASFTSATTHIHDLEKANEGLKSALDTRESQQMTEKGTLQESLKQKDDILAGVEAELMEIQGKGLEIGVGSGGNIASVVGLVQNLKEKLVDEVKHGEESDKIIDSLKDELENKDLRINFLENGVESLKITEKSLKNEISAMKSEQIDAKNRYSSLETDFSTSQASLERLRSELAAADGRFSELEASIDEEKSKTQQLVSELSIERQNISREIGKTAAIERERSILEKLVSELQGNVAELREGMRDKDEEIEIVRTEVEKMAANEKAGQAALLESLESEDSLREENQRQLSLILSLKSSLSTKENEFNRLSDALSTAIKDLETLRSNLQEAHTREKELLHCKSELTSQIHGFQEENKGQSTALVSEKRKLEEKLEDVARTMREKEGLYEEKTAKLAEHIGLHQKSIEQYQQMLVTAEKKASDLSLELSQAKDAAKAAVSLKNVVSELENQLENATFELKSLRDENRAKQEILQNTNRNILSTRQEIEMWKKCIEEKNEAIQQLRQNLRKSEEEKCALQTQVREGKGKTGACTHEGEIQYIKGVLERREKELFELKEKGQLYYAQADEAIEAQRKEIEVLSKRCSIYQTELSKCREELRSIPDDRRRLRSHESSAEPTGNSEVLRGFAENIDRSPMPGHKAKPQAPKSMGKDEVVSLKSQLARLREDVNSKEEQIEGLRQLMRGRGKGRGEEDGGREQLENQVESLSAGLNKITEFVSGIPIVAFNPEETGIVESTIKAIASIYDAYEAKCREMQSMMKPRPHSSADTTKYSSEPHQAFGSNYVNPANYKNPVAHYHALLNASSIKPGQLLSPGQERKSPMKSKKP